MRTMSFFSLVPSVALSLMLAPSLSLPADATQASHDEVDAPVDVFEEDTPAAAPVDDPLEGFNRTMFSFNDKAYVYVLKPVARTYRYVPEPARVSVGNFFSNLTTPVRFLNATLQLKGNDALTEFARFFINTTVGIGGLFDPAKKLAGLEKKKEDFGQTLGTYGMAPGAYLVLPFLGPSSTRDAVGTVVDLPLNPAFWVTNAPVRIGARTIPPVNSVSLDEDTYDSIRREQLDPYLFIRDAYHQKRAAQVRE